VGFCLSTVEDSGKTDITDVKVILALTLFHFIGDFYFSFVNPLLPVFVHKFSLTLTQVGLITGTSRFLAFVVQPCVGYFADRFRTRLFVLGGPLLAVICISLVGIAPNFVVLILFISLGAIGTSLFHPTSAGMVYTYSGRHSVFSMSIFNTGGTLAYGVGPLFITYFVTAYGLATSPFTMILGLMVIGIFAKIIPLPEQEPLRDLGLISTIKEVLGTTWKSILLIWFIMVLRTLAMQSFITFIPVLYAKEGYSLFSIGSWVSIVNVAGAVSGLLSGHLSDRIGYKPVFYVAHSLATPSLYLLLYLPGNWVFLTAFLAGFFSMATLPLGLAVALEFAPKGKAMIASLMMGLAFGTGGMIIPLAGRLADMFSIRAVLFFVATNTLLTVGLIFLLPERRSRRS
jgi:FSR family fosmidomycin resistance protein-like MFS transporter